MSFASAVMQLSTERLYGWQYYTLADLSDEMVSHMTQHDLFVLGCVRMQELDSAAVMDELRLQERWDRLHASHD